jgi:L-aspartate oxidase
MTAEAGVLRDAGTLAVAGRVVAALRGGLSGDDTTTRTVEHHELRNLLTVGAGLVASAAERTESRGAHTRTDHPDRWPTPIRLVVG